jgi:PAS domain S-box-containing protein
MMRRNLQRENEELRRQLAEAQQANRALLDREVDAVFAGGAGAPLLLEGAQRALRSSEQLFRALFTEALDGILIVDDEGRYVDVNPAACRLFGRPREQMLGHRLAEFVEAPTVPSWTEFRQAGHSVGELRLRTADGALREIEFAARAHFVPGFHLSIMRDVTERNVAERERRASEDRFRRIVETAAEGVWVLDGGDRTSYVNGRMAEILGSPPAEMIGRHFLDFLAPAGRSEATQRLARHRAGRREQYDARLLRSDGGEVAAVVSTSPMLGLHGEYVGVLAMVTDVTERCQLELQLRQAQKMESIGRFAGGIAHDFNNVLAVIMGYSDAALRLLSDPAAARPKLEAIQKATERAAALTRQILAFSRKQLLDPRVLDLATLVDDLNAMLRRVIGEDIELMAVVYPELGRVRADPSQIEQVILNLVVNARDAMPNGGTLVIELQNREVARPGAAECPGLPPGSYVVLEVRDTGVGMPEDVQQRIFEPFFTTKEAGKGTGLGLATVYGIVKQSGGYIYVDSAVGSGTTFTIYLPRVRGAAERARSETEPVDTSPRGTEAILFVDDDELIRNVVSETLASFGYRVTTVGSGPEALEAVRNAAEPPALLVSDLVMPRLNGRELADRLCSEFPGLRVLLVSGHCGDSLLEAQIGEERRAFLQKPFTPVALGRKVREILDRPAPVEPGPRR